MATEEDERRKSSVELEMENYLKMELGGAATAPGTGVLAPGAGVLAPGVGVLAPGAGVLAPGAGGSVASECMPLDLSKPKVLIDMLIDN